MLEAIGVVRIARLACAVPAVAAFAYIWLGLAQLDHLAQGRITVGEELGPASILSLTEALHDFTVFTIGVCVIVALTTGLFSLLFARVGNAARMAMIVFSAVTVALALLVMAGDGGTLGMGNVIPPHGRTDPEDADRLSAAMVYPWFPLVHYGTVAALMFGGAAAVVALAHSDSREYFRRHRQAASDARIWSVSRVRDARAERDPTDGS